MILEICREAFSDHNIFTPPYILERVLSGFGCHLANLANMVSLDNGRGGMTKHGRPENFRQHVCLVIPSGFGKSTILRTLFHETSGILSDKLHCSVRSTFSKESWMGSQSKDQGQVHTTDGIFHRFKRGIVAADEYARLAILMSGDGIDNDEVYLLTALDTDTATKDLSTGTIEVTGIGTTIISGLRVPREPLTMTSGLSRRFTFELFMPTIGDAKAIKKMNRQRGDRKPKFTIPEYRLECGDLIESFLSTNSAGFPPILDYSYINEWCDKVDVPHFEEDIYRRLAIGYSVINGTFPSIELTPELEYMFENEIETRSTLKGNVLAEGIRKVVEASPCMSICGIEKHCLPLDSVTSFFRSYYQMSGIEIRGAISASKSLGVRMDKIGTVSYLMV